MNHIKRTLFQFLILIFLTACTSNNTRGNWAYDEYERMIEPTSTSKEDYRNYEPTFPAEVPDSDGDGWKDNFDLCPDEPDGNGLAGCAPINISGASTSFSLWYQLPIDPGGRINVFGDRFLVLTDYELGELQIFDLANGNTLRTLQLPDMLNDSPTLLPQGIILKNYDRQRWRLFDYDGNEIFAANEELEIVSESNGLLVSRTDNTIFLRKLNDIKTIYNQFPGRYAAFTPDGMLSITNPKACTITLLDINNFTKNESYLFSPGNGICNQNAQFTPDGQFIFFAEDGVTHLISLQHPDEHYTYPGIPMGNTTESLLLLDGNRLYQQKIPDGETIQLLDASDSTIQKVLVHQNTAAILTRNIETFRANVTLINLETYNTQAIFDADAIQFAGDQYFIWSFGDDFIALHNQSSGEEIYRLDTPPISAVQTALHDNIFLVSGQDHQLYIYGPEKK